jgi:putative inorganic carbon (hco3(-)) transporter
VASQATLRRGRRGLGTIFAAGSLAVGASAGVIAGHDLAPRVFEGIAVSLLILGILALIWHVDPAWTMSAVIVLSVFSGYWQRFGLPPLVTPDRYLLLAAIIIVLIRAPVVRDRPQIPLGVAHTWILAASVIAVGSAATAGTLFQKDGGFRLLDRFGLLPFAAFVIAPVVFRTTRQRTILLGAFVVLGAYLGMTSIFEIAGPKSLVFPKYILDPTLHTHWGRARGPFIEATSNGFAMFVCATAAAIGLATWKRKAVRVAAGVVMLLCVIGIVLTLTRSVWISAAIATLVSMLSIGGLRRWIPVLAVATAALVLVLLTTVPRLSTLASKRANDVGTVYQRQNLLDAALAMTEARPLFGFGWATFEKQSGPYFTVSPTTPIAIAVPEPVHNVYASNLAELGIVGTTVWVIAMGLAFVPTLLNRQPGDSRYWRIFLGSALLCWCSMAMAAPLLGLFPSLILWTIGGVAAGMVGTPSDGHLRESTLVIGRERALW